MSHFQIILLAIVQGVSELFPISSVAHAVLTPWAFGWNLTPEFLKIHFLPVVVMLHLGTAIALLLYFRKDWIAFARSVLGGRDAVARRELLLVVVGTVPAGATTLTAHVLGATARLDAVLLTPRRSVLRTEGTVVRYELGGGFTVRRVA